MSRHVGDTVEVVRARERRIVELRLSGASTTEIAKSEGMTPGGVSVCLKRVAPELCSGVGLLKPISRSESMRRYWKRRKAQGR
jgi:hypothetical protein